MPDINLMCADHWFARAAGLIFRKKLKKNEVLWLLPCNAVHSIGMRYCIALYFLDQHHNVIQVISSLKPFRFAWCRQAVSVVETLATDKLTPNEIELAIKLWLDNI